MLDVSPRVARSPESPCPNLDRDDRPRREHQAECRGDHRACRGVFRGRRVDPLRRRRGPDRRRRRRDPRLAVDPRQAGPLQREVLRPRPLPSAPGEDLRRRVAGGRPLGLSLRDRAGVPSRPRDARAGIRHRGDDAPVPRLALRDRAGGDRRMAIRAVARLGERGRAARAAALPESVSPRQRDLADDRQPLALAARDGDPRHDPRRRDAEATGATGSARGRRVRRAADQPLGARADCGRRLDRVDAAPRH